MSFKIYNVKNTGNFRFMTIVLNSNCLRVIGKSSQNIDLFEMFIYVKSPLLQFRW